MKPLLIKITFFFICSLMGLLFIFSGYTKLYPIEPFEFTFIDLGVGGWRTVPFIARFMIGLEFLIGFLLIFGIYIKKFTAKFTIATLLFFSVYLIFIMIKSGNNGNCGCFGNTLVMTPLQALIKNGVMLLISLAILKYYEGINYQKLNKWLFGTLTIFALALPHILNYVDLNYTEAYLSKKEDAFKLELDSVYKYAKIHTPPASLSKGKHIIAFMSMSCPHCRIAAKKLRLIKEKNPAISIYLVLNGEYTKIQPFFEDTKARNIDYCILNGKPFIYLAGVEMPAIYMVNNSVVENWINYMQLDQSEIENWLAKP